MSAAEAAEDIWAYQCAGCGELYVQRDDAPQQCTDCGHDRVVPPWAAVDVGPGAPRRDSHPVVATGLLVLGALVALAGAGAMPGTELAITADALGAMVLPTALVTFGVLVAFVAGGVGGGW